MRRVVRPDFFAAVADGDAVSVPEPKYPLFECGCHLSKFDAREDGAWVSGLAYRGLFRFRVGAVSSDTAEITEIEEEALSVV